MDKPSWCACALALTLTARDAAAFELKHTPTGQTLEWPSAQVAFVIDPSVEAAVRGGAVAVANAVAAWSGVAGAPTLVTSAGPGGAKVAVDGQNSILLMPEGNAPAGDALAVTVLSYDDATGALVDADIVMNGIHAFAVLAAWLGPGAGRPRRVRAGEPRGLSSAHGRRRVGRGRRQRFGAGRRRAPPATVAVDPLIPGLFRPFIGRGSSWWSATRQRG